MVLALGACRRSEPHPAPDAAPSAAASVNAYAEGARRSHLQTELTRARARWQSKPNLGECSLALHEKEDLDLCQAANSALAVLEQDLDAAPASALPALENSALALARLSKRLRFLSLSELSKKRLDADAGAPMPAAVASGRSPLGSPPNRLRERGHRGVFELGEGPISQLMATSVRLERDAVRNLGAYLEYDELPVRRTAFSTVKRLHEQHPEWPLLSQLLREAALLESDADLKNQLTALSASAQPSGPHSNHSAESK